MTTDRTEHLDLLVANTGKAINETFLEWNARPKIGAPLAKQTVALDQFAAKCSELAQLLELLGQRATEVASEMLDDDDD